MKPKFPLEAETAWMAARDHQDLDAWVEHLDRYELCDHFSFLQSKVPLKVNDKEVDLSRWLNYHGNLKNRDNRYLISTTSKPIEERLGLATFYRWVDRVERSLRNSPEENLPLRGVLQYFSDDLEVCVLVGYRLPGSTVQLQGMLAFPNPESFLDPLHALKFARTDMSLDLLRRSLYSRHKIVLQRNTLVHIDREQAVDVFGPTIDTLFLNEWIFKSRFIDQRAVPGNWPYFEDPIPRGPTEESSENGTTFLEIGSGNGLITAAFAKNEARLRRLVAIDKSMAAIEATYRNSYRQRSISGGVIGDRGHYIVGHYTLGALFGGNDFVAVNPPYIPLLPGAAKRFRGHPLAGATLGTELLESVVADVARLVNESGVLAVVCSEMAEPEILHALPRTHLAPKISSRLVPFDVEAVRGEEERSHLKWLTDERGLVKGRGSRSYKHRIAIYLIGLPNALEPYQ